MKEKLTYLYTNKRTIIGLVTTIVLVALSIIETYTTAAIASDIKMLILAILSYCNVRGVLGKGFESVGAFLKIAEQAIDDVQENITVD